VLPDDTCADAAMVPDSNVAATIADSKQVLMGDPVFSLCGSMGRKRAPGRGRSTSRPIGLDALPLARIGEIPIPGLSREP
jgi:hypothetical protein